MADITISGSIGLSSWSYTYDDVTLRVLRIACNNTGAKNMTIQTLESNGTLRDSIEWNAGSSRTVNIAPARRPTMEERTYRDGRIGLAFRYTTGNR